MWRPFNFVNACRLPLFYYRQSSAQRDLKMLLLLWTKKTHCEGITVESSKKCMNINKYQQQWLNEPTLKSPSLVMVTETDFLTLPFLSPVLFLVLSPALFPFVFPFPFPVPVPAPAPVPVLVLALVPVPVPFVFLFPFPSVSPFPFFVLFPFLILCFSLCL